MRRLFASAALLVAVHVNGASIESLVMPGPVASAHAELEEQCSACHAPFSKATQTSLCLDCHEDIAADLAGGRGFHGTGGRLADTECRACHTEHQGRDADIAGLVPEAFDHSLTGFPLTDRHAEAVCQDCHEPEKAFRETPASCAGCHERDDPHLGNLGNECQSCHATSAWADYDFDHAASTGFALRGGHTTLACESCHAGQRFEQTPTQCSACHSLDDVHKGSRGTDCAACHGENDWRDARFDHRARTGFVLEGQHADLSCSACHLTAMALAEPPADCVGCHSADDPHVGQRGSECGACHGQETWNVEFDHRGQSGFPLLGVHAELSCDACHRGSLEDDLPTDCEGCHQADDPHAGSLPACTDCHAPQSWTGSLHFDHEFTRFPLLGLHRLAACEQCHASLTFHEAGSACIDCHRSDDAHEGSLGDECSSCHSPAGWARWRFDHDRQTDFALTGAHAGLACAGCHLPGSTHPGDVSSTCGSCHQADDVHNGQFGDRCERCHTTEAFSGAGRMF